MTDKKGTTSNIVKERDEKEEWGKNNPTVNTKLLIRWKLLLLLLLITLLTTAFDRCNGGNGSICMIWGVDSEGQAIFHNTSSRYNAHVGPANRRESKSILQANCTSGPNSYKGEVYFYMYAGENPTDVNPWNALNIRHRADNGWWFTNEAPTSTPITHLFMSHVQAMPIGADMPMSPLAGVFGQAEERWKNPAQWEPTNVFRLYSKRADNSERTHITRNQFLIIVSKAWVIATG
jgi:hypothetical protein